MSPGLHRVETCPSEAGFAPLHFLPLPHPSPTSPGTSGSAAPCWWLSLLLHVDWGNRGLLDPK